MIVLFMPYSNLSEDDIRVVRHLQAPLALFALLTPLAQVWETFLLSLSGDVFKAQVRKKTCSVGSLKR